MRRDAGTSACSPNRGPPCDRVRQSTPAVPSVHSWELLSSSSSFRDLARDRAFFFFFKPPVIEPASLCSFDSTRDISSIPR